MARFSAAERDELKTVAERTAKRYGVEPGVILPLARQVRAEFTEYQENARELLYSYLDRTQRAQHKRSGGFFHAEDQHGGHFIIGGAAPVCFYGVTIDEGKAAHIYWRNPTWDKLGWMPYGSSCVVTRNAGGIADWPTALYRAILRSWDKEENQWVIGLQTPELIEQAYGRDWKWVPIEDVSLTYLLWVQSNEKKFVRTIRNFGTRPHWWEPLDVPRDVKRVIRINVLAEQYASECGCYIRDNHRRRAARWVDNHPLQAAGEVIDA